MAKGKRNAKTTTPVEEAKKIRTGETTDLGFIKALKAKGIDAKAEFPAETLRTQLDSLDDRDVSFYSTNETILKVVNNGEEPEPTPVVDPIVFKGANAIDGSKAEEGDNPGIAENDGKYTVEAEGNTINVTDLGMTPYIGGNIDEPRKWVGILVDLGVKVKGVEYNIEDVDYSDAARWGATNDSTFIMWLTVESGGGNFTFKNLENEEDTITLTVTFSE